MKKRFKIKNSDIYLFISFIIFIVTYNLISIFNNKSMPILLNYAKEDTINISTILINEGIKNFNVNETIMSISKNSLEEIISIDYNYNILNKEMVNLNDFILNKLHLIKNDSINSLKLNYFKQSDSIYYIPIGVLHGIDVLTDMGPKIPFKIKTIGSITSNIDTKVTSYGINNALLSINIKINLSVMIILPFKSEKIDIEKRIPIESKVINGKVPTYYGGIINTESKLYTN